MPTAVVPVDPRFNVNLITSLGESCCFALLGKKVGMTQVFNDKGDCVPVTVVQVEKCVPILKRTVEKDGYQAVMFWGGLRGAVSLALALLVIENQAFDKEVRDFVGVLVTVALSGAGWVGWAAFGVALVASAAWHAVQERIELRAVAVVVVVLQPGREPLLDDAAVVDL